METKIRGLKVLLDDNYIIIKDAYQIINDQKMKEILEECFKKNEFCRIHYPLKKMVKQWKATNRLYHMHINKKHNKDLVILTHISIFKKILYNCLGF